MLQIKAFLGNRPAVETAVREFLGVHPDWWVADTRDWQRPGQLVAPLENLLLRLSTTAQVGSEVGSAPGMVIAAIPVGPIDSMVWLELLGKLKAEITELF